MNKAPFQFFRLRIGDEIVGFMRFLNASKPFFSKDRLWWNGNSIDYKEKDSYIEFDDINKQWIFESDIVEFKEKQNKDNFFQAVILFDPDETDFVAINCENFQKIKLDFWPKYKMKIVSYLFINPQLADELFERGYL